VKGKAKLFFTLAWGLLIIGLLTLVVITTPNNAIGTSQLPEGVNLNPIYNVKPVATRTPSIPLYLPTTAPSVTPTLTPTFTSEPTLTTSLSNLAEDKPTPTLEPTPTPVGIIPTRLRISSIGVDTRVEKVGQTKEGAMDVPKNIWDVGWYELGTRPGEIGSAVIDGHLDGVNGSAIFWNLNKLKPGQKIYVADETGKELTFEVTNTEIYPFDKAPLDKIFLESDDSRLNLITCNGTFDYRSLNYNNRLVVYSKLVKDRE
jgi:LPXTG-site transpeptidase (sortase) family protein